MLFKRKELALVTGTGYVGTLIFGLIKRALIPFGLHHVFYMPFWQTAVGGTMEVAGKMVQVKTNHFYSALSVFQSLHIFHISHYHQGNLKGDGVLKNAQI